jgi:DNA-binding response OmpR family regulator
MNTILLLDVDLVLRDLLQRKLEHEGYKVMVGSSDEMPFPASDLVISGETLLESKLKQWFKSVPVIRLSHEENLLEKDIWQLKVPFRPSELLDLAKQRLSRPQFALEV